MVHGVARTPVFHEGTLPNQLLRPPLKSFRKCPNVNSLEKYHLHYLIIRIKNVNKMLERTTTVTTIIRIFMTI